MTRPEPPVRGIFVDEERGRITCVCQVSRLRWHMSFDDMTPAMRRQWCGYREANWMLGLHGRASEHAIRTRTLQ